MGGETSKIAEIANKVSTEVFKWFRWDRLQLIDQNFGCLKAAKHAPNKKSAHTHPVDVTFSYIDPYLGTRIIFNTDLKSYKKNSIDSAKVRAALKSIAQTIDCARVSEEWQKRYSVASGPYEIRGLLFVYNNDAEYDKNFFDLFENKKYKTATEEKEKSVSFDNLPVEAGMLIHVIEPKLISYMTTVLADIRRLIADSTFPKTNYQFFYPDLKLHKTHGDGYARPATIEMISGPFLIVQHDPVTVFNETSNANENSFEAGFVIFYNRPGASAEEFLYFIDTLSNFQILDGSQSIRIRIVHEAPHRDVRSHFQRAIEMYIVDWGFDDFKRARLEAIELTVVEIARTIFSATDLGWEKS